MNEAKHTKGPWTYTNRDGIAEVHGDSGDILLWEDVEGGEEAHANARLIAAAPEQNQALLDAPEMDCWADMTREELERVVEGYTKWFHGQRAEALRKAEGK